MATQQTTELWIIFIIRTILSFIGFILNFLLVFITFRTSKLHSVCNWLIALESACLCLFHLTSPFTLAIMAFNADGISLSNCFFVHALSVFGVLMAFQVMLLIGFERLLKVFFPIWSRGMHSNSAHILLLLFSFVTCCYLVGVSFSECNGIETKVLCQVTDISSSRVQFYSLAFMRSIVLHSLILIVYMALWLVLKTNKYQNSSYIWQKISRSLTALAIIELLGWLPSLFLVKLTLWLQLNANITRLLFACYAILTIITASMNTPILYALSQNYREAFNGLLHDFGWKKEASGSSQQHPISLANVPTIRVEHSPVLLNANFQFNIAPS